jgi:dTDP-4-dehydrorhamnose 3,5-epimerase
MKFQPVPSVAGAFMVHHPELRGQQGWSAEGWFLERLHARGLFAGSARRGRVWESNRGTLRGLHYQLPPYDAATLVSGVLGAAYHVLLDVRTSSPTYGKWAGISLGSLDGAALYVPSGCAYGFLTLTPDTMIELHATAPLSEPHLRWIRWDDPWAAIQWPARPARIAPPEAGGRSTSAADADAPHHVERLTPGRRGPPGGSETTGAGFDSRDTVDTSPGGSCESGSRT